MPRAPLNCASQYGLLSNTRLSMAVDCWLDTHSDIKMNHCQTYWRFLQIINIVVIAMTSLTGCLPHTPCSPPWGHVTALFRYKSLPSSLLSACRHSARCLYRGCHGNWTLLPGETRYNDVISCRLLHVWTEVINTVMSFILWRHSFCGAIHTVVPFTL